MPDLSRFLCPNKVRLRLADEAARSVSAEALAGAMRPVPAAGEKGCFSCNGVCNMVCSNSLWPLFPVWSSWTMSYCPRCGKSMERDRRTSAALCPSCGTSVQLPSKSSGVASFTRPESGGKVGDHFCLRCGQPLRGREKFCSACSAARSHEIPTIY